MLNWLAIDTVLLDLDGTLLDLNFDNYFWQEYVPQRYAEQFGLTLTKAKEVLFPQFKQAEGTLNWYCVDYWSRILELDIALLKSEVRHLIAVHPHVPDFLQRIRSISKRAVLVTNAHQKSLSLKFEHTRLNRHLDSVISAHDIGLPKEDPEFWLRLQDIESYAPLKTLLIDDNLSVLRAARQFGIAHLLTIRQPDTRRPPRADGEFTAIQGFDEIMPSNC